MKKFYILLVLIAGTWIPASACMHAIGYHTASRVDGGEEVVLKEICNGHGLMVLELLKKGWDLPRSSLDTAVETGNARMTEILLEQGANIRDCSSCLSDAIRQHNDKLANVLLEYGYHENFDDFILAIKERRWKIAIILLPGEVYFGVVIMFAMIFGIAWKVRNRKRAGLPLW